MMIILLSPILVSCPDPPQKKGERGLVNLDCFLGLAGSVGARAHCGSETNLGSDWLTVMGVRANNCGW